MLCLVVVVMVVMTPNPPILAPVQTQVKFPERWATLSDLLGAQDPVFQKQTGRDLPSEISGGKTDREPNPR